MRGQEAAVTELAVLWTTFRCFYCGKKYKDNRESESKKERKRERAKNTHKITEQSTQTDLVIITRRVLNHPHVQTFLLLATDIMHGSLEDSHYEYMIRDA